MWISGLVLALGLAQEPPRGWAPKMTSLGPFCSKGIRGNDGDCGCENTPFRTQAGKMHIMESVATHPCSRLFPRSGSSQACSYFRIRELATGKIVANVSEAIDHDFCSALADHERDALWVFCSAFGRRNKAHPGPCSAGFDGCYVGAWKTRLSGDFSTWTPTAKAVALPLGVGMANNDATLVSGALAAARARALAPGVGLPAHQAVMILETDRGTWANRSYPQFAINVGTDGDLSRHWVVLDRAQYRLSGPASSDGGRLPDGEGTGDAPTLRYDAEQGHYYSLGGGWITNGPARSASLAAGTWESSKLAPIAIPAARAANHSLPVPFQLASTCRYGSGSPGSLVPPPLSLHRVIHTAAL